MQQFEERCKAVLNRLCDKLAKSPSTAPPQPTEEVVGNETHGLLILNPRSTPQRFRVQNPSEKFYENERWNFANGMVGHDRYTAIDVPSLGFVLAPAEKYVPEKERGSHLAEVGGVLQNEFLEAQIDTKRGHLRSFHVPAKRGNRLSLMLALRCSNKSKDKGAEPWLYSQMSASDVKMLTSSNMCGLIRATGKLNFDGSTVAHFEIDYETWRGSRIMEVAVRLSQVAPLPSNDLWNAAFVLRLAWANESAQLKTFQDDCLTTLTTSRFVAPQMIEIDEAEYRTHYLPNGLAFHRRTDSRFLETVLPVDRSQEGNACDHRIGIAVDLPHPKAGSADFMDQRYVLPITDAKPKPSHACLFLSADATNVLVDLESPLLDAAGKTVGLKIFVTECNGKAYQYQNSLHVQRRLSQTR